MLIHAQARAAHKTRRLCSDFTPRRRRGESLYCKRSLEIYFASGEDVPSDVVGKAGLPVGLRPRRGAGGRRLAAGDRRGASSRRRPDAAGTGCWRVLRRRGSGQTQRAIWRPSRAGASGGRGRSAGRERSGRPGASLRAGAPGRPDACAESCGSPSRLAPPQAPMRAAGQGAEPGAAAVERPPPPRAPARQTGGDTVPAGRALGSPSSMAWPHITPSSHTMTNLLSHHIIVSNDGVIVSECMCLGDG